MKLSDVFLSSANAEYARVAENFVIRVSSALREKDIAWLVIPRILEYFIIIRGFHWQTYLVCALEGNIAVAARAAPLARQNLKVNRF